MLVDKRPIEVIHMTAILLLWGIAVHLVQLRLLLPCRLLLVVLVLERVADMGVLCP